MYVRESIVTGLPIIDYADILYINSKASLLKELQRVQNKCLKTCLKLHLLIPSNSVHAEAELPLLSDRRIYHIRLLAFKRVHKGKEYIQSVTRTIRANVAPLLKYLIIHATSYEHSPEVICAQVWNRQPPNVRMVETIGEYKSLAKDVLVGLIPKIV